MPLPPLNEELARQRITWWMRPMLWGLDTPITALLWAFCFIAVWEINVMTMGPPLLLTVACWIYSFLARIIVMMRTEPNHPFARFYRGHVALLIFLIFCAFLALVWTLLFSVGLNLIFFCLLPVAFLFASLLPMHFSYWRLVRLALRSMSLATACAAPAYFFAIVLYPNDVLHDSSIWILGGLLFLFHLERMSAASQESKAFREGCAMATSVGLLVLFLICLGCAHAAPSYEKGIYYTLIIGLAGVELLSRLRERVAASYIWLLGWPVMALAPLLGILLFFEYQVF